MSNYYNLDGIVTALKNDLSESIEKKRLWQAVTYPTKKDGKPFANMNNNFEGATIRGKSYAMQPGETEISVHSWELHVGHVTDSFDIYNLVKYLKDEKQIAKKQNYMPKQTYLEQVYAYDLDDIKQAIAERIVYFEQRIISLEKQIAVAEKAFTEFKTAYGKALDDLEKTTNTNDPAYSKGKTGLYYAVLDTVKERYPYC